MIWDKKGIVFDPQGKFSWASHTALQPTPIVIGEKIRIFAGFRDDAGISRVGWVDVDIENPEKVLGYSQNPALDIGLAGAFDDNGVVPTAIVRRGDALYLYYAGYQLVKNVRFIAFTGLAISHDDGLSFQRWRNTPVLERTTDEFLFRAIHTIFWDTDKWKTWYGGGNSFVAGEQKTLPIYDIRYMESADGIAFPDKGQTVLKNGENEYRVGRPYVVKRGDKYIMYFGASTPQEPYRLAYAESNDGVNWDRNDSLLDIPYQEGDFDSRMSAYPSVIDYNNRIYLFYNGNDYGKQGFGLAISTQS
jgi:predicted GH43/DUF377 family glycosyl hydrolase